MATYTYLFGPVPSRRFGRSLGVDLIPHKTCTEDCIFCQVGRTTHSTLERREYVPIADVLAELKDWLDTGAQADYVTLAGSGEPTLHSRFGDVLRFVQEAGGPRTALLTNGTLLQDPAVRADACLATIVKVSLSAWDQASFQNLNRPHPDLVFEQIIESYRAFRSEYGGELWLEVFLVDGVNAAPNEVRRMAELAATIAPDRIQLNTTVRPPAESYATAVGVPQLTELANLFTPTAEVIVAFAGTSPTHAVVEDQHILDMLHRHPCSAAQIASVFGLHDSEVAEHLGHLREKGAIRVAREGATDYFVAVTE